MDIENSLDMFVTLPLSACVNTATKKQRLQCIDIKLYSSVEPVIFKSVSNIVHLTNADAFRNNRMEGSTFHSSRIPLNNNLTFVK